MINYNCFYVARDEFRNATGANFEVREETYLTNDSGEGLFTIERGALKQHRGNGQFYCPRSGGMKAFLSRMNPKKGDYEYESRLFGTRKGAEKYAETLRKLNPIKKIIPDILPVGTIVSLLCGKEFLISAVHSTSGNGHYTFQDRFGEYYFDGDFFDIEYVIYKPK